jgi:hypothetical protein
MIEMHVHRRKNILVMAVLHVRQLFVQHAHVVIVNQRHRSDDIRIGRFPRLLDQVVANQIPKCLRAIRISALLDQAVELLQQQRIDRDANSCEITHAYILRQHGRHPASHDPNERATLRTVARLAHAYSRRVPEYSGVGNDGCHRGAGGRLDRTAGAA